MRSAGLSPEEWKRHYRRMTRVSLLVLFLEAPVPIALNALRGPVEESLVLSFAVVVLLGALPGALLTYFVVLPVVGLSEVLGRRFGGREAWWWVAVALAAGLAPFGLLAALTGVVAPLAALAGWGVWVVLLTVPALFARIAREGLFVDVALWGTLVWLSVGTLGLVALHFGG
ncbi:hypothetical protein OHT52_08000 [Streptomyces sp. NBC_00247]|uniref:hypothetical protein n=1 Tax=Streptomyces sp. NBC_00247 TaxID=2975689 RepID=UPI002E28745E|nr:hypothetical protein [Streptomyces sp. NBC_00247]